MSNHCTVCEGLGTHADWCSAQAPAEPTRVMMYEKFDDPVSVREILHKVLDQLLDEMVARREVTGMVNVTTMDTQGGTVMPLFLALDLDPAGPCGDPSCPACSPSPE